VRNQSKKQKTDRPFLHLRGLVLLAVLLAAAVFTVLLVSVVQMRLQIEDADALTRLLTRQEILLIVFFLLVLLMGLAVVLLILVPLRMYTGQITSGKRLPLYGAHEMRYLAKAYNRVYEENRKHYDALRYEAEHDPLTGLLNRGAFDRLWEEHDDQPIALLMLDVDNFKSINDTYGHDVGDKVLKRVAVVLNKNFRASDYPCRVGGDEFAVIMTNITPNLKEVVRGKIETLRKELSLPVSGQPDITICVGAALTPREKTDLDLFKMADVALYRVKNSGKGGYAFYEDIEPEK